jgi:hypothetical protein
MKQVTFFPLSPYYFKYIGLATGLGGLLLMILLDVQFQLLLYTGLLIMVFSRERNDTEYVASVRAEVFKSVFGFTLSLTLALHLTEWLSEGFDADLPTLYLIGFPLLLYLLLFYGTLVSKTEVNSSVDFAGNLKKYPWVYVPWLFIAVAVTLAWLLRITGVI